MKILFGEYPGNVWNPGGKERRMRDMARELAALGAEVGYHDPWSNTSTDYDILQLFGSEYYQLEFGTRAKQQGLKLAVFSILVFQDERQLQLMRLWSKVDRLCPLATSFRLRRDFLNMADLIMFSGREEQTNAREIYGITPPHHAIVHSTVSPIFADADPTHFQERYGLGPFAMYAGRLEPRKNILRTMEAALEADLDMVLIGGFDTTHPEYCAQIKRWVEREPRFHHIEQLGHADPLLPSAYAAASVSVLASFHETCGMVNLEATLAGTNVVTSALPSVREYMRDIPWYVDPQDTHDIAAKLREAADAPFNPAHAEFIASNYTTRAAAQKMYDAYTRLLNAG